MRDLVSQRQLERMVAKWGARLRLGSWRIGVRWASEAEIAAFFAEDADEKEPAKMAAQACAVTDADGPSGYDTTAIERREVKILLKRGAFDDAREVESTVVHELLHIVLWPLTPPNSDRVASVELEQAINTLEEALMGTTEA